MALRLKLEDYEKRSSGQERVSMEASIAKWETKISTLKIAIKEAEVKQLELQGIQSKLGISQTAVSSAKANISKWEKEMDIIKTNK